MYFEDIVSCLCELDMKQPQARKHAVALQPRVPGGTKPWDCLASDHLRYVVKCQNNPQDERMGKPLKFLTTDLVCGRLGQLFDPPVCPEVEIIDIPPDVARSAIHPATRRSPAYRCMPGPSFGSRLVENAIEVKMCGPEIFAHVELKQVARLIIFQTWLRGVDVSALVTADGRLLSVDHGYYLTIWRWDDPRFAQPEKIKLKIPSQFRKMEQLEPSMFADTLDELMSIPDIDIVRAFGDIPFEWGVLPELRAKAAAYVLSRRSQIAQAVSRLRK